MNDVRILVVEDDPLVARIHEQYVNATPGFRCVGTASTAQEALRLADALHPDLVLLDVYLPDRPGIDVLKEIRQREIPTDVVLVTAAQDVGTVRTSLRYGALDYLIKPFTRDRLEQSLRAYRRMLNRLEEGPTVSQVTIDSLRGDRLAASDRQAGIPALDVDMPKGLTAWTLRQVLLYLLNQHEPQSAAAVGVGVGLSRIAARRYLEYLCSIGRAERVLRHQRVGRPLHLYQVSPPAAKE